MKDLSRHIEYLLCEHNSVAIPGIGMFVTEELPARYYPQEKLFLPPVRSVRLDINNNEDDHKLEDSLIRLHRVTRNVAHKWIAEYVDYINQSLMDMGFLDMGTIGRLVFVDNNISFEVCEAGVNTPELYGLDSFHIAKLPSTKHKRGTVSDPTHFTIRLRRTTIHRIMTAAAVLIVALTVILPHYNEFNHTELQAGLQAAESIMDMFSVQKEDKTLTVSGVVVAPAPEIEKAVPEPVADEAENTEIEISETETTEIEPTEAESSETEIETAETDFIQEEHISTPSLEVKGYCVVMASAITNSGAEHLIEKLNKEGFTNAVKYRDNGMLRVLLVGYDNETMARADAAVVRATDKLYSGTWIKKF